MSQYEHLLVLKIQKRVEEVADQMRMLREEMVHLQNEFAAIRVKLGPNMPHKKSA